MIYVIMQQAEISKYTYMLFMKGGICVCARVCTSISMFFIYVFINFFAIVAHHSVYLPVLT